jgi:transposase-like protein
MVRPGRDQLKSPVEVDETYIGGVGTQIRGRGAEGKTIVAIAAEIRGKGPGRIRMAVVPDVSSESLHAFIEDNVQMGSEVRTDGWSGYKGLEAKGYRHKVINIAASGDAAHVVIGKWRCCSCSHAKSSSSSFSL